METTIILMLITFILGVFAGAKLNNHPTIMK
jgi:flagellin-like protein